MITNWDSATYERYKAIRRLHLSNAPCFSKPMDEISRLEIKKFLRELLKIKALRTVEAVHTVISGIFNEGKDEPWFNGNPATGLRKEVLPSKEKRHVKDSEPFTLNERNRLEAWAEANCTEKETMLLKVMNWLSTKEWTHRTAKLYEATGGVPPWEKDTSTKNSKLKLYDWRRNRATRRPESNAILASARGLSAAGNASFFKDGEQAFPGKGRLKTDDDGRAASQA